MQQDDTVPTPQRTFLGHPLGLSVLFGTEMGERFCYYGNNALMPYYMIDFLFAGPRVSAVIGYASVKSLFEGAYGPLAPQPLEALIYGTFAALTYLAGLAGGAIADRFLGQTRAVILGASIMAVGEFMLVSPRLFFIALLVFVVGVGLLKPNVSTQVGGLYAPGDARADRAYSIFYIGINLGALIAPLICGPLGHAGPGEPPRWQYGFAAAGVAMLLALGIFVAGLRVLPPDVRARRRAAEAMRLTQGRPAAPGRLTRTERRTVAALFLIAFCNLFFWGCYGQQYSTIAVMAERNMNLRVGPITLYPEAVQSINPFFIFTLTPLIIAFWAWQGRRGREPAPVTKMAMGCGITALCFAVLILPGAAIDRGQHVSVLWVVAALMLQTLGELYLFPVALSLFSRASPARLASVMMAVNFLSLAVGNYLAGYLASFWTGMGKAAFFTMIAGIAGATAVAIFALSRVLNPVLAQQIPAGAP